LIKSTPTKYKGHAFRSRLEARWAVYFDAIGIEWWYEMEGYQLPSGWYLPDFWLPQVEMFAEVKPVAFNETELKKVIELVAGTKHGCLLLDGVPAKRPYLYRSGIGSFYVEGVNSSREIYFDDCVLSMYKDYPINEGRFYSCTGINPGDESDFEPNSMFDDVPAAVLKAKTYRF
jgi:hypothetical protein